MLRFQSSSKRKQSQWISLFYVYENYWIAIRYVWCMRKLIKSFSIMRENNYRISRQKKKFFFSIRIRLMEKFKRLGIKQKLLRLTHKCVTRKVDLKIRYINCRIGQHGKYGMQFFQYNTFITVHVTFLRASISGNTFVQILATTVLFPAAHLIKVIF